MKLYGRYGWGPGLWEKFGGWYAQNIYCVNIRNPQRVNKNNKENVILRSKENVYILDELKFRGQISLSNGEFTCE